MTFVNSLFWFVINKSQHQLDSVCECVIIYNITGYT